MKPLIVALDVESHREAITLVKHLQPQVDVFKVGPVLFLKYGGLLLAELRKMGAQIFLDLKFHDIPSVVQKAIERAGEWGVYSVTLHLSGGMEMVKQAVQAKGKPKLWGVTVLTSFDANELKAIGVQRSVNEQVMYLAANAKSYGLDGVISSVSEAKQLKKEYGKNFTVVTPGIRLAAAGDDQKRVETPLKAIQEGADFFVMGRPILEAKDPVEFVKSIYKTINIPA